MPPQIPRPGAATGYIVFWLIFLRMLRPRIRYTEGRLLGFSYDFGVTRNSSSNADAMVLASARLRGIHPPDNIQNDERPGGECLLNAHWLGPWRQHFDDESWRGSGYSIRPSVYLILWLRAPHSPSTPEFFCTTPHPHHT